MAPQPLPRRLLVPRRDVRLIENEDVQVPVRRRVVAGHLRGHRADRGIRVGVSRQQGAFGVGIQLQRLFEEFNARHSRHALVHKKKLYRFIAQLQLFDR